MKSLNETVSLTDAIDPSDGPADDDVRAWQDEQLKERHKRANEGRFASPDAVKAVIAKFVPNG